MSRVSDAGRCLLDELFVSLVVKCVLLPVVTDGKRFVSGWSVRGGWRELDRYRSSRRQVATEYMLFMHAFLSSRACFPSSFFVSLLLSLTRSQTTRSRPSSERVSRTKPGGRRPARKKHPRTGGHKIRIASCSDRCLRKLNYLHTCVSFEVFV